MTAVTHPDTPRRIVVMGVSGCGKSSVGQLLAKPTGLQFKDGDDLHPQANKDKMANGIPLTDEDRWPWLDLVGCTLSLPGGAIVACSALKKEYRDRIRRLAPDAVFVHLVGSEDLLMERLTNRKKHFMPPSLLKSQLATLEPLEISEMGQEFDIQATPEELTKDILAWLLTVKDLTPSR